MEREIKHLKQELAMHEVLSKKGAGSSEAFSAEKQYEIQQDANDFLTGKTEDIEFIGSVRLIKEYLNQMKTSFIKLRHEQDQLMESHSQKGSEKGQAQKQKEAAQARNGGKVGTDEGAYPFGLGKAPKDLKPVTKIEISKEKEKEIAAMQEWEDYSERNDEEIQRAEEQAMIAKMEKLRQQKEKRKKIDKNSAFLEYKTTAEAKEIEASIVKCRADLN